jgi:ribonuclease P protein component
LEQFLPLRPRETDLPAQRAPAEAQAWFPGAHGDARRTRHSETASRAGPEASLSLSGSVVPADFKRVDRSVQTAEQAEPAQSGVGVASDALVQRRHRLSRSRDFDAVYRQGRSTSTRFLVLYWFDRDDGAGDTEPRLGLAVPKAAGNAVARNRIKRQLREAWRERLDRIPASRDYVLIAKPGLPEAVQSNGFAWLGDRIDEVLTKAAA